MSQAYIFDVDDKNFEDVVVGNSHKLPVLVDFWADWCEPCKALAPILHKVAEDLAGKVILAKVNSDQQQVLAQKYGVRSLPTVKLFVKGEVVSEFTGAVPESQVRDMLAQYIFSEADQLMAAALQEYEQGNIDAAIEKMAAAASMDSANIRVQLLYARVLAENHRQAAALQVLANLPADKQADPEVVSLRTQLDFAAKAGEVSDAKALLKQVEDNPGDLAAREQLSAVYVSINDYPQAMAHLLEIMKRDRSYNDDAGRKGLLRIFELLGSNNPLVGEYRRKMSLLLF